MDSITAILKCQDGRKCKIDFDIACSQSVFMASFRENAEVSDTLSCYGGDSDSATIDIDLSSCIYLKGDLMAKICEYWIYCAT